MQTFVKYSDRIKSRGKLHYIVGLIPRILIFLKFFLIRLVAKKNGMKVGKNTLIPLKLAQQGNGNLCIGNSTVISTHKIDNRNKITIGNFVIIGNDSKILTTSHNIDSTFWERKDYGLLIEDYVWIAENVLILPSCRHIGKGAVIGSGSVVYKDVPTMAVVSGNPAVFLKHRKAVHDGLVVESLKGGDLVQYVKWRFLDEKSN